MSVKTSCADILCRHHVQTSCADIINGRLMRDKIQYTDTLDVYKAYIDGGRKQNFRKAHTDEIEKYEAAKERLREAEKQLGHKPSPMKELKAERAQLKEKGDILGAAYKKAKNESKERPQPELRLKSSWASVKLPYSINLPSRKG